MSAFRQFWFQVYMSSIMPRPQQAVEGLIVRGLLHITPRSEAGRNLGTAGSIRSRLLHLAVSIF